MAKLKVLFLVFSLVYVVVSITSTVSHCWMQTIPKEDPGYKRTQQGLFMECKEDKDWCTDLDDKKFPEWYLDVRALAIVSCLFSSFALYVEILHQIFEKVQKYFTTVVMLIANILLLVAVSIYSKKHEYDMKVFEYGWGFMLSWVAFTFGVAVVVIGFVAGLTGYSRSADFQIQEVPTKDLKA